MPAKLDYSKLTTPADFKKAAVNFTKRNQSLKQDMQAAALCALVHMDKHGDYTSSMLPLLDASKTFGKNLAVAFAEWVMAFSWLTLDDDKNWVKDKSKVMDIEGAKAQLWHEMEKDAAKAPFDLQKAIEALFKKIAKADIPTDDVVAALAPHLPQPEPVEHIKGLFQTLTPDAQMELVIALGGAFAPAPVVEEADRLVA